MQATYRVGFREMKPQFYILYHLASKCSRKCRNKNCDAFNENQQNGIRWLRLNINTNKETNSIFTGRFC